MPPKRSLRTESPVASLLTDDETSDGFWVPDYPPGASSLLTSAVICFARNGFHATTNRDITGAVGLSPASLYLHFESKEDVLFTIMRVGHQRALDALTNGASPVDDASTGDPVADLAEVMRRLVEWHARFHTIARVCQYELSALTPEHMVDIAGIRRRFAGVVRTGLARGVATGAFDISTEDVGRTVRAILSLGIDLVRWYRHDRAETPEELGIFYADLTLRMLGTR